MKIFKLPKVEKNKIKTLRFPNDVVEGIEQSIRKTNCTFSAFVIEACAVALENLKNPDDE